MASTVWKETDSSCKFQWLMLVLFSFSFRKNLFQFKNFSKSGKNNFEVNWLQIVQKCEGERNIHHSLMHLLLSERKCYTIRCMRKMYKIEKRKQNCCPRFSPFSTHTHTHTCHKISIKFMQGFSFLIYFSHLSFDLSSCLPFPTSASFSTVFPWKFSIWKASGILSITIIIIINK